MKTAVINFKVDPKLKAKAQKRADKLGIPLSMIMNRHLKEFAEGAAVSIEFPAEKMTPHMEKLIAEIEKENEELGTVGPFDSVEEAIAYLDTIPPYED